MTMVASGGTELAPEDFDRNETGDDDDDDDDGDGDRRSIGMDQRETEEITRPCVGRWMRSRAVEGDDDHDHDDERRGASAARDGGATSDEGDGRDSV